MRSDQEDRQRQGLRTVFKPLKEWNGKTDESQWRTLRRLLHVWPDERSSKRRKNFIRERSHWSGSKLVKEATKKLFSDRIKKKHVKLWNRCIEDEGDCVENLY
jgi:hypothetical protein